MIFSSISHIGLIRKENQDAIGHLETEFGSLYIICDGVGGLPNGALASKIAVDSIISIFSNSIKDSPELQLQQAMEYGQKSVRKANPKPLGTTVATCFFHKNTVYTSWCGDSRIYHLRNNEIIWMSKDHSVLHDILNKGKGSGGMFMNPQALNRFFGREFKVKSDYYSFDVDVGDQILICSDGLSNFLPEPDIIHAITNNSPDEASDIMKRKLLSEEIDAPDNFSWYIIHI